LETKGKGLLLFFDENMQAPISVAPIAAPGALPHSFPVGRNPLSHGYAGHLPISLPPIQATSNSYNNTSSPTSASPTSTSSTAGKLLPSPPSSPHSSCGSPSPISPPSAAAAASKASSASSASNPQYPAHPYPYPYNPFQGYPYPYAFYGYPPTPSTPFYPYGYDPYYATSNPYFAAAAAAATGGAGGTGAPVAGMIPPGYLGYPPQTFKEYPGGSASKEERNSSPPLSSCSTCSSPQSSCNDSPPASPLAGKEKTLLEKPVVTKGKRGRKSKSRVISFDNEEVNLDDGKEEKEEEGKEEEGNPRQKKPRTSLDGQNPSSAFHLVTSENDSTSTASVSSKPIYQLSRAKAFQNPSPKTSSAKAQANASSTMMLLKNRILSKTHPKYPASNSSPAQKIALPVGGMMPGMVLPTLPILPPQAGLVKRRPLELGTPLSPKTEERQQSAHNGKPPLACEQQQGGEEKDEKPEEGGEHGSYSSHGSNDSNAAKFSQILNSYGQSHPSPVNHANNVIRKPTIKSLSNDGSKMIDRRRPIKCSNLVSASGKIAVIETHLVHPQSEFMNQFQSISKIPKRQGKNQKPIPVFTLKQITLETNEADGEKKPNSAPIFPLTSAAPLSTNSSNSLSALNLLSSVSSATKPASETANSEVPSPSSAALVSAIPVTNAAPVPLTGTAPSSAALVSAVKPVEDNKVSGSDNRNNSHDQSGGGEEDDSQCKTGFPCTFPGCYRVFARTEHLRRHVRSHTGEKPHFCPSCGKNFSRSDNMRKHLQIHMDQYTPEQFEELLIEADRQTRPTTRNKKINVATPVITLPPANLAGSINNNHNSSNKSKLLSISLLGAAAMNHQAAVLQEASL